jgi:hypothetical protein
MKVTDSGRRTSDLNPTPEADGEGDGVAASVGDGVGVDGAEVDCGVGVRAG